MLTASEITHLTQSLPVLHHANPQILRDLQDQAFIARIPAGHDIFAQGDRVEAIAVLLSGAVRVYQIGETGREITLYRFHGGESCILTANAILNHNDFPALATAEEDIIAVMIPSETFRQWVREYDVWRDFVFNLLSQRLASIMEIVDEVAFRRMDVRLASFLLEEADGRTSLQITHQEIAAELGSSREVISRILGSFGSQGLVRLTRGTIDLLDMDALRTYSLR